MEGEIQMYAKSVDRKRVDQLIGRGAILVDMRSPVAFRNGSISGSVNLPLKNFLNQLSGMDRKTNIILFADAEDDSDVVTGTNYAAQLGFTVFVSNYKRLRIE